MESCEFVYLGHFVLQQGDGGIRLVRMYRHKDDTSKDALTSGGVLTDEENEIVNRQWLASFDNPIIIS
jgi:hypothetical protein